MEIDEKIEIFENAKKHFRFSNMFKSRGLCHFLSSVERVDFYQMDELREIWKPYSKKKYGVYDFGSHRERRKVIKNILKHLYKLKNK